MEEHKYYDTVTAGGAARQYTTVSCGVTPVCLSLSEYVQRARHGKAPDFQVPCFAGKGARWQAGD